MSATEVRVMTARDWRAMGRLRAACHTHAGASVDKFTNTPLTSVHTKYQTNPHIAIGLLSDSALQAYICCYATADYWVLDLMVSSGNPSLLHPCLEACLQHYEAHGIRQFYYAFPEKWARAYRSFWRDSVPSLRKYEIHDVQVIPANRRPDEPWVWQHILHENIVPVNLLLRRSRCPTPTS